MKRIYKEPLEVAHKKEQKRIRDAERANNQRDIYDECQSLLADIVEKSGIGETDWIGLLKMMKLNMDKATTRTFLMRVRHFDRIVIEEAYDVFLTKRRKVHTSPSQNANQFLRFLSSSFERHGTVKTVEVEVPRDDEDFDWEKFVNENEKGSI